MVLVIIKELVQEAQALRINSGRVQLRRCPPERCARRLFGKGSRHGQGENWLCISPSGEALPQDDVDAMRAEWADKPRLPPASRKRGRDDDDDDATNIVWLTEAADGDVGIATKLRELRGDGLVNASAEGAAWVHHDEVESLWRSCAEVNIMTR
jgi:hypothetical protein